MPRGIGRGEQRARRVVAGALPQVLHARAQVDHGAGLAHHAPILLGEHDPAARGDDKAVASRRSPRAPPIRACRKPASPSISKMVATGTPVRSTRKRSVSMNSWPGAVRERLPERRLAGAHHAHEKDVASAHRAIVMSLPSRIAKKKPRRTGAFEYGRIRVSATVSESLTIRGVTKISSSVLLSVFAVVLEEVAQERDVAEERDLGGRRARLLLEDAAQHDRVAVVDEHLGRDRLRVDRRDAREDLARRSRSSPRGP